MPVVRNEIWSFIGGHRVSVDKKEGGASESCPSLGGVWQTLAEVYREPRGSLFSGR